MTHTHLAFVFPDQGSQSVDMLAELSAGHLLLQRTFTAARARCWPD